MGPEKLVKWMHVQLLALPLLKRAHSKEEVMHQVTFARQAQSPYQAFVSARLRLWRLAKLSRGKPPWWTPHLAVLSELSILRTQVCGLTPTWVPSTMVTTWLARQRQCAKSPPQVLLARPPCRHGRSCATNGLAIRKGKS